MIVFRICQTHYANDLSGTGAKLYGGRWNKKGTAVTYTSESRSLCLLELAVHLPIPFVSKNYSLVSVNIPESAPIHTVLENNLPKGWHTFPTPFEIQEIGDKLLRSNEFLAIKVPSAIVTAEFNYLINPNHPFFHQIEIVHVEPFRLDERLIKN